MERSVGGRGGGGGNRLAKKSSQLSGLCFLAIVLPTLCPNSVSLKINCIFCGVACLNHVNIGHVSQFNSRHGLLLMVRVQLWTSTI